MHPPKINCLIQKGLIASVVFAAGSLILATVPATACTVSTSAKPRIASAFSGTVAAMALGQVDTPEASAAGSNRNGFVGLWDAKLISGGQVVDEGFDAFHSDGTEILITQDNPITENVCLGVWEQTGPSTIKLKHPSWYFDTNGNLLGVVIIRETLTLDHGDDSYRGSAVEDVYDTNGNKGATYEYEITGRRITVD